MNFRQLSYFLAVVEEKGFSAASRRLNIAQPALSGHIAALEQELGVKLLERSNKGVRTTSAGRRLAEHARNILRQIDTAKSDVSGGSSDPGGEVAIALPFTAARVIAGPIARRVEERYPRVSLKIFEGFSYESGNIMASGKVDLGVVPNAAEIENLDAELLFYENLYLIGRWDGKQPRESDISFADLPKYPLAMGPKGWSLRRTLEHAALDAGIQLNIQYETPGAGTMSSMINEGLCYSVINWVSIQHDWDRRELMAWRIVNPNLQRTIALVWPKDRPMTEAVEGVRSIVRDVVMESVHKGEWRAEMLPDTNIKEVG